MSDKYKSGSKLLDDNNTNLTIVSFIESYEHTSSHRWTNDLSVTL